MKAFMPSSKIFILLFCVIIITCCSRKNISSQHLQQTKTKPVKIGFIAKDLNTIESTEMLNAINKFTESHNIELYKAAAITNQSLLKNIDSLSSKGVKGIIISSPDPKLGPAIMTRTKRLGIKILSIKNSFFNFDGTCIQEIPYLTIPANQIENLVINTIKEIYLEKDWQVKDSLIILMQQNDNSLNQGCIESIKNQLNAINISDNNIIQETPIPSPDGLIISPASLYKVKSNKFKHVIIFGFNSKKIINTLNILEKHYKYNLNAIVGFGVANNQNSLSDNLSKNFYGCIDISQEKYGSKAIQLLYDLIIKDKKIPYKTTIPVKFIKNPNYK